LYSQVDHHRHSPISAQHDQTVTPLPVRQSALGHENPTSKEFSAFLNDSKKVMQTNLGTRTEIKNDAMSRWMQNVVLGNRGLPLIVMALKPDEKNMGAIPTTGNGDPLMMPQGSSIATAGTKAHIATMRSALCWSTSGGDGFV
jgi:hypothetical protein